MLPSLLGALLLLAGSARGLECTGKDPCAGVQELLGLQELRAEKFQGRELRRAAQSERRRARSGGEQTRPVSGLDAGDNFAFMAAPTQDELIFHELRATDWFFVKRLLRDLQEEFQARERYLIGTVSRYVIGLELFRLCEQLTILDPRSPSQRDRSYHRGMLAIFRGLGELLLADLRQHEEIDIKPALGYGFADLAATVEELAIDERMHYGEMTDARREQILGEVFGGDEQSPAR